MRKGTQATSQLDNQATRKNGPGSLVFGKRGTRIAMINEFHK